MVTISEPLTRQTLTVEEAAKVLGIGRTLAYQMVREGTLPTLRFGGRRVVPRQALDRMLAGNADLTDDAVTIHPR